MGRHNYWDDYEIGQVIETTGRTITHADIRLFIGATDATHPAHVDEEYAKAHPFGRVVAPGSLVIGVVDGFVVKDLVPSALKVAHYGYDRVRFLAPVFVGDTLRMSATVRSKRDRSDEFGLIEFTYDVKNQEGNTVAAIEDLQLVERRT